jgi:hemolysin III
MKTDFWSARINIAGFLFFLIAGFILLVQVMTGCPKIHYGLMIAYLVVMFAFWPIQIIYHLFLVQKKEIETLRRVDRGSMLFLLAAIFSPVLIRYSIGPAGLIISIILWSLSVVGLIILLSMKELPRILTPKFAFLMGILGIGGILFALNQIPQSGIMLFGIGAAFLIAGGIVYSVKKPDLFPEFFGFHELFHTLMTIGTIFLHFLIAGAFLN